MSGPWFLRRRSSPSFDRNGVVFADKIGRINVGRFAAADAAAVMAGIVWGEMREKAE